MNDNVESADLETVIIDLLDGQYKNPIRVVSFNTAERWSQDVSADVAHELRTPVTGLVSAAALLPTGEVPELVRDRTARLRSLVEELLEISRLEGGHVGGSTRTRRT